MEGIYVDNAATTRLAPTVLEAMLPYYIENFGNPSTLYTPGRLARKAVEKARKDIAVLLAANPEEIFFTAGGTESDNWAIKGIAYAKRQQGNHIITTAIEHHAVLNSCHVLETEGFRVTYLPVDGMGRVSIQDVRRAICKDTILISVMMVNNEIGTIQPIEEIGSIARSCGITFHTDAVQAAPHLTLDVDKLGVDLLSLSAHKFYGPKGTGVLYVRKNTALANLIDGGSQERSLRAGTENVPGIVGTSAAYQNICAERPFGEEKLERLCRETWEYLKCIPGIRRNGDPEYRIPGLMSLTIPGLEAKATMVYLNTKKIFLSAGAACTAGQNNPSHVLTAIGLSAQDAACTLRISFGTDNYDSDARDVADALLACARVAGIMDSV